MRKELLRPAAIALAVSVLAVAAMATGTLQSWQWKIADALMVGHPAPADIVIVVIDDASIQRTGAWPWDRSVHARIVRALTAAGARVIGYDVNFPEPRTEEGDKALEDALRDSGRVVLPLETTIRFVPGEVPGAERRAQGEEPLAPLPRFAKNATLGVSNTPLDPDGVARRIPREVSVVWAGRTGSYRSFFNAVLEKAGERVTLLPHELIVDFAGPAGSFAVVPAADVLAGTAPAERFRGKIVLVGATAPDLHDTVLTPTAKIVPMSGVEVHANAVASARTGGLVEEPLWLAMTTAALFAAFAAFAAERFRRIRNVLFLIGGLLVFYLLLATVLVETRMILSVFHPLAAFALAGGGATLTRLSREKREKGRLRATLSRYVSPQVVAFLLDHPEKLALGGEKREMTVLFSDLRGFTSLSEKLKPEELVSVLNRYLSEMTAIVFAHEGVLDKYMGDAVMAFWNAPLDDAEHAEKATRAAIAMRDRLREMNATGAFPAGIALRLGAGVNTGPMVVGNVGGTERFDYTVMGDAVNLGSRLEGLNKEYGTELIVSETTARLLTIGILLRPLDLVAVKGKKEPVEILEVVGIRDQESPETIQFVAEFADARALYRARKFIEARETFRALAARRPDDAATKTYVARSEEFAAHPPPAEWDGVWVMTKK